jgi:hypothetical protein
MYVGQPGTGLEKKKERAKKALRMMMLILNSGYDDRIINKRYAIEGHKGLVEGLFQFMYKNLVKDYAEHEVDRYIREGRIRRIHRRRNLKAKIEDKSATLYRIYRHYGGQSFVDEAQSFTPQARRRRWQGGHGGREYDVSIDLQKKDPTQWQILTGGRGAAAAEDKVMREGYLPRVDRVESEVDDGVSLANFDFKLSASKFKASSKYRKSRNRSIELFNQKSKIIK